MTTAAEALAYVLLGATAFFQGALSLGAPWGQYAYGGRAATEDGRLPTRFRATSGGTVPLLGVAAYAAHADTAPLLWIFTVLFTMNTAANLTGKHPVERWGMSAGTLTLAGAYLTLALA